MPDAAARALAALDDAAPAYTASKPASPALVTKARLLPFPHDFAGFIKALMSFKELLLAGAMESQCACEGWSEKEIILRADPAADAVIKQRLRAALQKFEGGADTAVTVTVADDGEILSEAEKQRAAYAQAEQAVMKSADMQRIRRAFPAARITDIHI